MLIIIIIAILSIFTCIFATHIVNLRTRIAQTERQTQRYTIASLTYHMPQPYSELSRNVIAYLNKYAPFEFEHIECVMNPGEDVQAWVRFILDKNPDLIYVQSEPLTRATLSALHSQGLRTPVVANALALDFLADAEALKKTTTPLCMIGDNINWEAKIKIMKKIIPHMRTVLVITKPLEKMSPPLLKEKNTIITALRKEHISWTSLFVEDTEDVVDAAFDGMDAVVLSHSFDVIKHTSAITAIAQKKGIPTFSLDNISTEIFMGISADHQQPLSIHAAQAIIEFLEEAPQATEPTIKKIMESQHIILHPHNAPLLTATNAIGNLLEKCNTICVSLKKTSDLPSIKTNQSDES